MKVLEAKFKDLMQRRFFIARTFALLAAWMFPRLANSGYFIIHREVTFPYPMTFDEYEALGAQYCDSPSITRFTDSMRASGELISIDHRFTARKIEYKLVFRDSKAFERYVTTIDRNWFKPEQFNRIGFQVRMRQGGLSKLLPG
jgi:hypothetical protein